MGERVLPRRVPSQARRGAVRAAAGVAQQGLEGMSRAGGGGRVVTIAPFARSQLHLMMSTSFIIQKVVSAFRLCELSAPKQLKLRYLNKETHRVV
jgi:hypothetical protein